MKSDNFRSWVKTVALVAIALTLLIGLGSTPAQKRSFSGSTDDFWSAASYRVSGTEIISSSRGASLTTGSFSGLLTLNGGQLRSSTNSTSTTATTQTLVVADINGYDTISLTPNTGALTLTWFASSTASAFLPTAGDMQETCIYNATTTAAATITVAAAAGIDMETSSSTPSDLTILAGNHACIKMIRQPATASTFDISVLMTEFSNAD